MTILSYLVIHATCAVLASYLMGKPGSEDTIASAVVFGPIALLAAVCIRAAAAGKHRLERADARRRAEIAALEAVEREMDSRRDRP